MQFILLIAVALYFHLCIVVELNKMVELLS